MLGAHCMWVCQFMEAAIKNQIESVISYKPLLLWYQCLLQYHSNQRSPVIWSIELQFGWCHRGFLLSRQDFLDIHNPRAVLENSLRRVRRLGWNMVKPRDRSYQKPHQRVKKKPVGWWNSEGWNPIPPRNRGKIGDLHIYIYTYIYI